MSQDHRINRGRVKWKRIVIMALVLTRALNHPAFNHHLMFADS